MSDECSAQIYSASVSRCRKNCPSVNFTSTILCVWSSLPCVLHISPNFFYFVILSNWALIKSYVSLFCPKTLPEGTWSRDLNSSKHSSILFLFPLSHSFPSVILCTPLNCCYINVAISVVLWLTELSALLLVAHVSVCMYVCMCLC